MKKLILFSICCLLAHTASAQTVNLIAPTNGTTVNGIQSTLQFTDVAGESGFVIQVDAVNTFNSPNLQSMTMGPHNSSGNIYAGVGNLAFGTTYYWRVAAMFGATQGDWSAIRNFNTLTQPSLYLPENGLTVPINTYLQWSDVAGETGYVYQMDTVNTFDSPNLQTATAAAFNGSGYPNGGFGILAFGTTYYWRVAILNGNTQSNWSNIRNFTTYSQPVLISPTNGETVNGILATLQWANYEGETGYKYEVDTVNTFDSPNLVSGTVDAQTSFGDLYIGIGGLSFGTTYYWRVAILSVAGQSNWSSIRNFNTVTRANLISPANGTVNVGSSVFLNWSNITGETGYAYQLDTSPNFDSSNLQSGTVGAYTSAIGNPALGFNGLLPDTTYYWRIALINDPVQSQWSTTWVFGTGATLLGVNATENERLSVYPNPTSGLIFVSVGNTENAQYSFFNVEGKALSSGILPLSRELDMSAYPKGIYFLKITSDKKSETKKIIKQ